MQLFVNWKKCWQLEEETRVSATHLRTAWDASYDFLTVEEAVNHATGLKNVEQAQAIMSWFLATNKELKSK